jgi:UDPglucose 6-dehydrogenase
VLNAVIEVNELQKRRVIGKLKQLLGSLRGRRVALLGLAFKPNTDDTRESPAFVLAGRLLAEGADVVAWDPIAHADGCRASSRWRPSSRRSRAPTPSCSSTAWPELADVDWARSRRGCGAPCSSTAGTCSTPPRCAPPRFEYDAIGRASR